MPATYILQLLKLVLSRNNFAFNGKNFLQIMGVPMGSICSPTFAILFLHILETKLLQEAEFTPDMWKRFIDDIFGLWNHGEEKLLAFFEYLNAAHPTIKFTLEYSKKEIPFLDTVVYKSGNKLQVRLYSKPTDTHSYLTYDSCHPNHSKKNGPYGQFLRIKQNNTDEQNYQQDCVKLNSYYQDRGYPTKILQDNKSKADQKDRTSLLHPLPKGDTAKKGIPFVTTYHPTNIPAFTIIRKYWDSLNI
jgi:hypothetical protein